MGFLCHQYRFDGAENSDNGIFSAGDFYIFFYYFDRKPMVLKGMNKM